MTTSAAPVLAVVEHQRICRASAAAQAQGIRPGMSAATARALGDDADNPLVLRERQPAAEQALLNRLAHAALQFTPQVSIDGEDVLLLEIGGSLRLFHGLNALRTNIADFFVSQGLAAQSALAATPGAARLFAGNAIDTCGLFDEAGKPDVATLNQQLAALPVTGLGLDSRTEESIMQMGLNTFGDIEALPRQAIGRRFGSRFTLWLDRVTGAAPDPRQPVAPETFFVRELNFLDGISHADGLLFPMQRLLGEFGQFLRHRQLSTQHLVWRLTHVDHSTQEIAINTSRPETSPAHLLALTRVRLDTTRVPAPVETLRLACRQFAPVDDGLRDTLFPEPGVERDRNVSALIDRLRARLGDENCRQLLPLDSWRPEAAQRFVVAGQSLPPGELSLLPSHLMRRPLWLLREPMRAERQGTHLRWHGMLELLDGPERIDSDWWSTPLHRDYFVARHCEQAGNDSSSGVLYWVFHDLAQDTWYVHGLFG